MTDRNLFQPENSNDTLLIKKVESGCKKSFDILFEKYWEKAFKDAYNRLKDVDQAKDVVQEIFTHIWIKRETIHISNIAAYLSVAVRNKVFKIAAKQKVTHPFFDLLEQLPELHMQPDKGLNTKDFFRAFNALVESLPPRKQVIFKLRFMEDMDTREIAEELGISRKTVQNQLSSAVDYLRVSMIWMLVLFSTEIFQK